MQGKEFEAAYVRAQTEGHQKLLRIQEDYLASGKDPAHINVAKLARGQIKEHVNCWRICARMTTIRTRQRVDHHASRSKAPERHSFGPGRDAAERLARPGSCRRRRASAALAPVASALLRHLL
ncbi:MULTISPECIES: DUF4142 domain-containing protein [unclassified Bradyrhizobium]|uniref:DUF4142 domain-containing protein n=1 Tax=unclassified Bradyrhizobium TaxID=2631580 RepID=UPI001FFAA769|nr:MULTISPECIES: DUF4142 domain-containing protein [unclassified Bradyrhizobium]